jgi:hypothetical protein
MPNAFKKQYRTYCDAIPETKKSIGVELPTICDTEIGSEENFAKLGAQPHN